MNEQFDLNPRKPQWGWKPCNPEWGWQPWEDADY